MFFLKLNEEIIMEKKFKNILIIFNNFLSNVNETIKIINHKDKNSFIEIQTEQFNIILGHEIKNKLSQKNISLLPFFIFRKKTLEKLNINYLENLIKLDSYLILNILIYYDCLLDPFYILLNVFNLNKEIIYQTFVLYLNKSLFQNNINNEIKMNKISEDFLNNNENNDSLIMDCNKLLIYYIKAKQIYPFVIKYEKYNSDLL